MNAADCNVLKDWVVEILLKVDDVCTVPVKVVIAKEAHAGRLEVKSKVAYPP